MSTRPRTPAAALAVSLADAKVELRITPEDVSLDSSITRWIKAITLEAEHQIGRSVNVAKNWRLTLDAFPDALRLDYSPVLTVDSIKFYDAENVLQTLDPADYYVDTVSTPGFAVPAPGKSWPETFDRINAVIVDYVAGTGDMAQENIEQYILARLQEQFDPSGRDFKETVQSKYAERLLDVSRTYA